MKTIVIALGGSLLDIRGETIDRFIELIREVGKDYKVFVVVGGGKIAKEYIRFGRKHGIDEEKLDEIGIAATRLNAKLISTLLGIEGEIPHSVEEAVSKEGSVVIMGGTEPGHSTDAVAAELAVKSHAEKLIIATDVRGVYDKDPKKFKDACFLKEVSINKLIELYGTKWKKAGDSAVIDGPALRIIRDFRIRTVVVNGKDVENLKKAIYGEDFDGTRIKLANEIDV